jgi:glutamate--cysteine ligase
MPKRGKRGIDMMLRTCTVQANLDYTSEANMVDAFRTALSVSPLITALFANSPIAEGRPAGALSERTRVWHDTDPDRSGFPSVVFEKGFGYEAWVNFILDVPMYFIRRGSDYVDVAGASFRGFMQSGMQGFSATVRDFADHMTTVFTEVRAKPYLEMRSADCGPIAHLLALPALWKGILYDAKSLKACSALFDPPSAKELSALQMDAAVDGFDAMYRGRKVLHLAEALLENARDGLSRIGHRRADGADESIYLAPLFQLVEANETEAQKVLKNL